MPLTASFFALCAFTQKTVARFRSNGCSRTLTQRQYSKSIRTRTGHGNGNTLRCPWHDVDSSRHHYHHHQTLILNTQAEGVPGARRAKKKAFINFFLYILFSRARVTPFFVESIPQMVGIFVPFVRSSDGRLGARRVFGNVRCLAAVTV